MAWSRRFSFFYCPPQSFSVVHCVFTQWLVADHNFDCLVSHNMATNPLHPQPQIYTHPLLQTTVFLWSCSLFRLSCLLNWLAGRRRRVFCKRPRLPAWKETQTWDKHLPFSCDCTPGVGCHPVSQHSFLTSCLAEMPTESVLLPSQLCSDCGQWSAMVCLLCHRHNQNSLRPVSSLSPKLYFSPTFRAPLLPPPPLAEGKERDRERESQDGNIQYKMLRPI